jgi:hypothetical protein
MRPKFIVRVKTASGEYKKAKRVTIDGYHIVMNKGNKKTAFWGFSFTRASVIPVRIFFGLFKRDAIDVFQDATQAINYDFDAQKSDAPIFDKQTSKSFITTNLIRELAKELQEKTNTLTWIMIVGIIGNMIISFLIARRIGIF